ncbi:MAG: orotidine-5'-phosphate decarboxylase [Candidatus Omnitrophica bacterium]|nr:orotidine-5'-phosphate decarboxylase [Candidatus Omnitrophota bacterium]
MGAADRLIVALDYMALAPALRLARQLKGLVRTLKIGSALFTACGPAAVRRLRSLGFDIMLDLKFFDIPSTVELSCQAAARQRVSLLTVHAAGGRAMLEAAVAGARAGAARAGAARPKVLAVTVLTSDEGRSVASVRAQVLRLAQAALQAGCDGVVASAQDAAALRRRFGRRLHVACPGIRPAQASSNHDQRRVCTPQEALAAGADRLVVGRPITGARRPRAAAQQILSAMEGRAAC